MIKWITLKWYTRENTKATGGKSNIKDQKLTGCWWKHKNIKIPRFIILCYLTRVGEGPYGSNAQPALLLIQINVNWRCFTRSGIKVAKCIKWMSDQISKQNKNNKK